MTLVKHEPAALRSRVISDVVLKLYGNICYSTVISLNIFYFNLVRYTYKYIQVVYSY